MPELRDLIRHWVEDPDAPSLYIRPEREVLAEMVAEAVANTSYSPWEERDGPPVTGIPHWFTELTPAEIEQRDWRDRLQREQAHREEEVRRNLSPMTVENGETTLGQNLQVANQLEGCMGAPEVSSGDVPSGWENAPMVSLPDGIPRRWFACSNCRIYKPCREWYAAVYNYRLNFADTAALLPPSGPEFTTEYRCNACIDGRTAQE